MSTERIAHSGAYRVSEFVTDGIDTWLLTESFYGYNKRESERLFRRNLRESGLKLAD